MSLSQASIISAGQRTAAEVAVHNAGAVQRDHRARDVRGHRQHRARGHRPLRRRPQPALAARILRILAFDPTHPIVGRELDMKQLPSPDDIVTLLL